MNGDQILLTEIEMRRGRGESLGRNSGQRDSSQSHSKRDVKCYHYHKKGHSRRNREELTRHLETKRS